MKYYPESAMERAMKIQEVILRGLARKITWIEAAEILGISARQMRRWLWRYKEIGYDGLYDRRRGQPSPRRVPMEMVEEVLRLYQEVYFDLNAKHFHEKLVEEHGIKLSYSWVKSALQGAGLIKRSKKRGPHRKRRPRRPLPGMMLHIDGSKHRWFGGRGHYDLIVVLDDATNEVYYAQIVEEESTRTVMTALKAVIESKGLFCSLYSDRASHFFSTPKAGEMIDRQKLTQVGRALKHLGIEMIAAYSPQARGRGERNFKTWQGRLPQELRLRSITTIEAANAFLREHYIDEFNRRFSVHADQPGTAFLPLGHRDLDFVFSIQRERSVASDNTVQVGTVVLQIEKPKFRYSLAGCHVTVCEHLDSTLTVWYGQHVVGQYLSDGTPLPKRPASSRVRHSPKPSTGATRHRLPSTKT